MIVSALSLGITYYVAHNAQERAIEDSLIQDMISFRATPSAQALAVLVNAQTSETDPQRRLLSYRLPTGRVVAGNAAITQKNEGFSLIVLGENPAPVQGSFLLLSEYIHGGLLTVAESAKPLHDLRETFLSVFFFSLLPTLAIAVFGGVLLARRSANTLTDLEEVLARLTSGDLSARARPASDPHDDLGRIGESVNRMAQAREKSTAALKQVSADIAHDLKSPIQRVAVQLSQLRDIKELPPEARKVADQAIDETQSIVETFQSLLQIAQLEGGSPKSRFVPVNLCEVISTFGEIYEPVAEEENRKLHLSLPETAAMIQGDKGLLGQMLANLIENALRHTPEGSDINIDLTPERDQAVTLTLRDQGPGIPETEHQNVLRRLYRLEQSRTTPGSGLGLSLVYAISELHSAQLKLTNKKPGLEVSVRFHTEQSSINA